MPERRTAFPRPRESARGRGLPRSPLRMATGALFAFCALFAGGSGASAASSDAVARIDAYLGSVKTLGAHFLQVVRAKDGQITDRASGTLSVARPDRFRWDYREPYSQTIVADGSKLWLYDPDLDQVTVRSLEQGLGATPAMLLSGAGKVGDAFKSAGIERKADWTWCRLAPRQQGSDFERVSLAFDARGELAAMELQDKLGQTTTVEFSDVKRGTVVDASMYDFRPPAGADVIGETAAGPGKQDR
jgi:outer membrane lipoprotein carrier protein